MSTTLNKAFGETVASVDWRHLTERVHKIVNNGVEVCILGLKVILQYFVKSEALIGRHILVINGH